MPPNIDHLTHKLRLTEMAPCSLASFFFVCECVINFVSSELCIGDKKPYKINYIHVNGDCNDHDELIYEFNDENMKLSEKKNNKLQTNLRSSFTGQTDFSLTDSHSLILLVTNRMYTSQTR